MARRRLTDTQLLLMLTAVALAIRLYLVFTSFCISADGPVYLRMAREFVAGEPMKALAFQFSPLYPWLISRLHPAVPDWELGGDLISAVFGTITVPLVYLLIRQAFRNHEYALGAAALTAIHPWMAEYSASVRTEAGFVCLMVAAVYLLLAGIDRANTIAIALAGVMGGAAYLYRAEAFGFMLVGSAFLIAGPFIWRRWQIRQAIGWAALLAAAFMVVASPYVLFLHRETGHWTISHELNITASSGMMETAANKAPWLALERSGNVSILAPLFLNPRAYIYKIVHDVVFSPYYLAEALGPLLTLLLALGLAARGRAIFRSWSESFLALIAGFYFGGFTLFATGPRLLTHLIAYTFGWVMIGFDRASEWLAGFDLIGARRAPAALAIAIALTMLPQTLWPLGYDIRAFRQAAADIRSSDRGDFGRGDFGIVSADGRVSFYAGAKQVEMPDTVSGDFCRWLDRLPEAKYLLMSGRDERRLGDPRGLGCVAFVRRYPRLGSGYFELFAVRRENHKH